MAGLLGQVFSAGNVARRKLTDLLGNPVLSAQQIVGNLNDRARVLNEMTSAAAQEGVNYGPASRQLAGLLAEAYNPIGMMVYHGSPAKFSRFDPTKIGSGEGNQSYGYGHYLAQNKSVADEYQRTTREPGFSYLGEKIDRVKNPVKETAAKLIYENKGDKSAAMKAADRYAYDNLLKKEIEQMNPAEVSIGNLYTVDLPDEQIAKMLDFDKPLIEQSKEIQALAKQYGLTDPDHMGGDLIAAMGAKSPAGAEAMRQAGIPGIRYFDQMSRGADEGTSNFVVFPGGEDLLTILRRNGGLLGP